ncbi:butyrophilin-like protein 2 [Echinops telfairi]|uniref:Butyrophilin-like protein 2 n=1 Tax=Echinops telfairi TaxID=9371 RepID=A0ABM0ZSP2_ECHTE|nr:butyrophilin-like protein 2 [Echinops telfairi]
MANTFPKPGESGHILCLQTVKGETLLSFNTPESDDFKVIGPAYPILAKVGEDALLTCQLLPKMALRHMEVRWYRLEPCTSVSVYQDGAEVTEMQMEEYRGRVEWKEVNIADGSVVLKINNIQPSDNGQYWCRFQEEYHHAETSLQLNVAALGSAPDIHMEGTVDSGVELVCTAKGWFPKPEVYWKNARGENIPTLLEHHIQGEDGLFYVESMLVVRDSATEILSCVIHSPILGEEKWSTISIPEKLQTELASLRVIGPSQPILARVGEDIQLTCYLSPKTNAQNMEVRWIRAHRSPAVCVYMEGEQVIAEQMEEYRGRTVLLTDAIDEGRLTLQISRVRTSDNGLYWCLFEKDGVYQETSLDLKVAGLGSSPLIAMKGWKEGEMQLMCSSDGWFPPPHVQWRDRQGRPMPSFSEVLTQDSRGLFHVDTALLVRNRSIVNVTCSLSNPLLSQEKTAAYTLSVHVTLDVNTAHPEVIFAEGNKCITRGNTWQKLPDTPQRFDCLPCVLGQEGFVSGRWSWDVEVGGGTGWFLGVASDDVVRKGSVSISPETGFWAIGCYSNESWAITSPSTRFPINLAPGRYTISLDYASGHLSFQNRTNKGFDYTFPKCSFFGILRPLFILWAPYIDSPDVFPVHGIRKATTSDSEIQNSLPASCFSFLSPPSQKRLTQPSRCQLRVL